MLDLAHVCNVCGYIINVGPQTFHVTLLWFFKNVISDQIFFAAPIVRFLFPLVLVPLSYPILLLDISAGKFIKFQITPVCCINVDML